MRLHNELGSHYEKIIQQANNPVRLVDGEHADDAHGPSTYLHLCHSAPPERDSQAWGAAKAQLVQWYVKRLRAVREAQGHKPHWYYCSMTWLLSQRLGGYRGHKTGANTMTRVSTLVGDFAHDWVDLHEHAAIAAGPQAMGPRHDEYGNKIFLGGDGGQERRAQAALPHLRSAGAPGLRVGVRAARVGRVKMKIVTSASLGRYLSSPASRTARTA